MDTRMGQGCGMLKQVLGSGVAGLMVGIAALGAAQEAGPQGWPFPHEGTDVAPDPALVWGRLPNGFSYVLMPHAEPPGRLSLRLFVGVGSIQERDDEQGLAHFLEHMAFNGTRHFPAGEMVEYFQRLGMGFGADTNASTGFGRTVYQLELPRTDDALLEESFRLLRDYADGMLLDPAEIERERGVILSEMRTRDSVGYRQLKAELRALLPETRAPDRLPIGIEQVLREAPAERFVDFYRRWYRPSTTVLVVVGDLPVERLEPRMAEVFGDWEEPAEAAPWADLGPVEVIGQRIRVHVDPEATVMTAAIQVPMPRNPDPNEADLRAMLWRGLAIQALNRRLEILGRAETSAFASGVAYSFAYFPEVRVSGLRMTGRPERWAEILATAEQELRRSLEHGFTEAELAEVVARRRNALEVAVRAAETRKARDLADGLAESLNDREVFTAPEQDLARFEAAVAGLEPATVLAAWRAVWPGTGRVVFVAGSLGAEVTETAVAEALTASGQVAVEAPESGGATEFAYTEFGPPGEVLRRRTYDDLGTTVVTFANGVRASLKPTQVERDQILVAVRFGRGSLTMGDRPELALFANTAFEVGGLGAHSYDEVVRLLAGRSVTVSFSVGADAFSLESATTPKDAGMALNVLTAYLTDPGFRPEASTVVEKNLERFYLRLRRTWQGVFGNEVVRFLASGDPRFGHPPQAAVLALTRGEVAAALESARRDEALEVTVVGDFELETMISEVARTLGALPERAMVPEPSPELRQVRFPSDAGGGVRRFGFESELPQAFAGVFWSTTDDADSVLELQLDLLAAVVEDRLRKAIREEAGDTYSPFALSRPSRSFPGYGFLLGGVIAEPVKALDLAEKVREVAATLAVEGIDEDELLRAREPYRSSREEAERTLRAWLRGLSGSAWHADRRFRLSRWRVILEETTAAEISALAARFLAPESAAAVVILPVPPDSDAAAVLAPDAGSQEK